jgi:hypothetical protein
MTEKAWDFFDIDPSPSLCVFFWQMVLAPFMILAGITIAITICIGFLFVLTYASGGVAMQMLHHFLPDSWFVSGFNWRYIVASLIIWFSVIGVIALRLYTNYRRDTQIEEGTYKPSVTLEFIKAKKRKICPFIEFK